MKNLMTAFVFLFLLLAQGIVMTKDREVLSFKLGTEWKAAYSSNAKRLTILEFIREGDDINGWKELVTYQNYGRDGKASPEEMLNKLKVARERECPGATEWNVI